MGVHTFGVQGGYASAEGVHKLLRKLFGVVGDNLEFITAFQTLQDEIDDDIRNEDVAKGGEHGVNARAIDEERKSYDGRVENEGEPREVDGRMKAFDKRGDCVSTARCAETPNHKRVAKARDYADADRRVCEVVAFVVALARGERAVIGEVAVRVQIFENHKNAGLKK